MRAIISGSTVVFGQARQQQKICKKLWDAIKNENSMRHFLFTAITCLDRAVSLCTNVPVADHHRSREITSSMIDFANKSVSSTTNNLYLKKGDIVHCTVTAIRNSWLEVQLKTNDARNLGTIHISRIARKYIADIHNEAKIGDIFQAKIINDDYYENHWGWDLTKIF